LFLIETLIILKQALFKMHNGLNYKKVKVKGTLKGEVYKMPLKINAKKN
jgi:hypothetical protein